MEGLSAVLRRQLLPSDEDRLVGVLRDLVRNDPDARVLDVGGGFGRLARTASRAGHEVVVVDSSEALLAIGEAGLLSREPDEVRSRVSWVCGNPDSGLDELPVNWFRLVLCRAAVLSGTACNPAELLENLARPLEVGGYLLLELLPDPDPGIHDSAHVIVTPAGDHWLVSATHGNLAMGGGQEIVLSCREYKGAAVEEEITNTLDVRVWTAADLVHAGASVGLRLAEHREDECLLALRKVP